MAGYTGYGTAPSIFAVATRNHFLKYFGVIGIFGPTMIFIWYTYVESWLLGFAYHALFGRLMEAAKDGTAMSDYLTAYQGLVSNEWFSGIGSAYVFFLITFVFNFIIIYNGVKGGIRAFFQVRDARPFCIRHHHAGQGPDPWHTEFRSTILECHEWIRVSLEP